MKLKTADLIIYGLVLIQPIAPVGIFGIANVLSHGHVTASILLAMVAMMLTALSYGRLAALYPSSGSAYSYVSGAFNPIAGYMVGWAMFLDYLIIPIVSSIYAALTLHRLFERVPFWLWVSLVIGLAGAARLLGGMARDNVLPARWFAGHTSRNIVFLGVVAGIGTLCLSYEQTAELINYGAFLAFMGVNLACMRVFLPRSRNWPQKILIDACIPLAGFLFCFLIWWALPRPAKIAGSIWLAAGALQLIFRKGITRTAELPMDRPSRRGA